MILELDDGREVRLPDDMSDESARQLKRLILGAEDRARTAEQEVRALRDEMAALRSQMAQVVVSVPDTGAAEAIRDLQQILRAGVESIVQAQLADRVLVRDDMGEHTISRARY